MNTPSPRPRARGFRSPCALSLLAMLALGSGAEAQPTPWRPLGPDGGEASVVLASPTVSVDGTPVIYAGSSGGRVFRSLDGGDTWTGLGTGLLGSRIYDLAFVSGAVPGDAPALLAATDRGLFRLESLDGDWQPSADGVAHTRIATRLATTPADPNLVFTTVSIGRISGSWALYRSTDGGRTWTEAGGGRFFEYSVALSATAPITLWAASFQGVYRSTNLGNTWQVSRQGLPQFPTFSDLTPHPTDPATVFTAARSLTGDGVLPFVSHDRGQTWTGLGNGLDATAYFHSGTLAVDPADPNRIFWGYERGVFRSRDGGTTWQSAGSPPADRPVRSLTVAPDGSVFAGVGTLGTIDAAGLLRSRDDGESWTVLGDGFEDLTTTSVSPDPESEDRILVTTVNAGLLRSDDAGESWAAVDVGRPAVGRLTRSRHDPSSLYLNTGDIYYGLNRLNRSTDSGATWQALSTPFVESVGPVVEDPVDAQRLYVAGDYGVWRSEDGGVSWQQQAAEQCAGLLELMSTGEVGVLVAGCTQDSGLPVSPPIYESFLMRSIDHGLTWTRVSEGPGSSTTGTWSLSRDSAAPSRLYAALAGFESGGALTSVDVGRTWTVIDGLAHEPVLSLVPNPRNQDELLAGIDGEGLRRSLDRGRTWHPYNHGLRSAEVHDLTFDPTLQDRIWAATGGGVHRLDLGAPTCVPDEQGICLLDRFRIKVTWQSPSGASGSGHGKSISLESGTFWFFAESNLELVVKVLDARPLNGRFWVSYGSLTDVRFTVTVTDTETGAVRTYVNPQGTQASFLDIEAF